MFLVAGSTSALAQEIINQNGDFSDASEGQTSDITSWILEGTEYADFEVVQDPEDDTNLVLRVTLNDIEGIDAWNVQAMNSDTQFSADNDYQISFRVRGDQDGTVQLDAQSGAQLWGQAITGDEWHTLETDMFSPDSDETRLVAVHFAHEDNENGDVFYIDDIEVREYEGDGGDNGDENGEESVVVNPNGSFEQSDITTSGDTTSIEGWNFFVQDGAEGTYAIIDSVVKDGNRSLAVTVEGTGTQDWSLGAVNEPVLVQDGVQYTFTLWARASESGATANFTVGQTEANNFNELGRIGSGDVSLTTEWEEYSFNFSVPAGADTVRTPLHFSFEENIGKTIYIDSVRITHPKLVGVPLVFEAESGELGNEWEVLDEDGVEYITITTDFDETTGSADYPGENRVASYDLTFPDAGEYDMFAKIRVGSGTFDDDSFFTPLGFGEKDPANAEEWNVVNGLAAAGYSEPNDLVWETGGLAEGVWKWVNLTKNGFQSAPTDTFTVAEDGLTHTLQIGAREDGLEIEKIAFGRSDFYYTVENLENGEPGSETDPREEPVAQDPIAEGKEKWLGNIYSSSQIENFTSYWNQVTPENAGKWGSVEGTRDNMNWSALDASYNLAKDNGYPFRFHVLVWGGQQPGWINDLDSEEQLEEITEWFELVAERYPEIDYLEVVNEGSNNHQLPDGQSGEANYIEALGGTGDTGHDWIITAFEMAQDIFPETTKLMINDYGIVGNTSATSNYIDIIEDLQERDLIDVIGVQAHAFSTRGTASQMRETLDMLGETGLPIQATEMDIDGDPDGTDEESDEVQLQAIQRIFPVFWEHQSVEGVTFWGWRPGLWRQDQDAFLVRNNGEERPALEWLRAYVDTADVVGVSNEELYSDSPYQFKLYENYPNPFNPTTQIQYDIASTSDVRIRVFDVVGRQVQTLVNSQQSPGTYTVSFDASNLSSGVYFYRIETGSFVDTKQMMLIK